MAVKALLHGLGQGPWGHDLIGLGNSLAMAVKRPLDPDIQRALARLSDYYIPARYPDAHPRRSPRDRYTVDDADSAIADAELVIGSVDDMWRQISEAAR